MYGSSLRLVTRTPRDARIADRDAAAMPFPSEETTPPVTNTNLVMADKFRKFVFYPYSRHRPNRSSRMRARRSPPARPSPVLSVGQSGGDALAYPLASEERQHRVDR